MKDYKFVTIWRVKAPIEKVWNEIYHSEDWPTWWKGVEAVSEVRKGDESGVGSIHRYTWKSKLPYKLSFDMETIRIEPPRLLGGVASREPQRRGLWQVSTEAEETIAKYDRNVVTGGRCTRLMSPTGSPVFERTQPVAMRSAAKRCASTV